MRSCSVVYIYIYILYWVETFFPTGHSIVFYGERECNTLLIQSGVSEGGIVSLVVFTSLFDQKKIIIPLKVPYCSYSKCRFTYPHIPSPLINFLFLLNVHFYYNNDFRL